MTSMTRTALAGALLFLVLPGAAQSAEPELSVAAGNIVVTESGEERELTNSGRDDDPVLTPDGKSVLYTRKGRRAAGDDAPSCVSGEGADELRRVRLDGSRDELVLQGHAGNEPQGQLCDFGGKQFSSDGRRFYFLSPAWATSAAVHVLDVATGKARYVLAGNDLIVINTCKGQHRDRLIVRQHRYLQFGGSFDWWWLFEPTGKEIGPVGEHESPEAVRTMLRDSGQCD